MIDQVWGLRFGMVARRNHSNSLAIARIWTTQTAQAAPAHPRGDREHVLRALARPARPATLLAQRTAHAQLLQCPPGLGNRAAPRRSAVAVADAMRGRFRPLADGELRRFARSLQRPGAGRHPICLEGLACQASLAPPSPGPGDGQHRSLAKPTCTWTSNACSCTPSPRWPCPCAPTSCAPTATAAC